MANITLLPSAKVPLVYDGDNTMTTEWYRFFWNVYGFTGDPSGAVPVNKGGTGLTSIGEHEVIIGTASNTFEPAIFTGSGIAITYAPGIINLAIGASGITPGTYGLANSVGQFTVNEFGILTYAADVLIGIDAAQIISGTIASARISGSYTGITGVGTLTVGTWNANTIAAAYGGTGQSSYTIGDLLYADSASTLAKLADVATGNALISGGVGTAPSWGKIDLTTHVSGILPVANGGTGQSSYTNGQLLIGNTTGNTLTKATLTAGSGVTITNGAGSITISATGTGGTVTSVSGTSPISVATGTTTPVISISQATTSTNGYLSSTDWNTFNNKQPAGSYLTAVSVVSANGFAGTSSGGTTPALTLSTTITGLLKGNGTAISAATSGTDYAPATSGTSILYGNGAGGFSNVTIGTGVSFAGGTLSATGTGGTVTSVSGTGTVNGITLTGTVTSSGSLTLGGTLSGIANSQLINSSVTINGSSVSLGGSVTVTATATAALTIGSYLTGTSYNGSTAVTIAADATSANNANKLVARGASGEFSAGAITGDRFIPASSTIPTNGMYLPSANTVGFATNSTNAMIINSSQNVTIGNASVTSGMRLDVNGVFRAGTGAAQGFEAGWSSGGSQVFIQGYDRTTSLFVNTGIVGASLTFNVGTAGGTQALKLESTGHLTLEGVTSTGATGTGKFVFDTSPTLITPALGTPSSGALTNCTSIPAGQLTGTVAKARLPTGTILQVVSTTVNTTTNTTGTTFVAATGVSAAITPISASNKIMITVSGGNMDTKAAGNSIYTTIYKDSTNLGDATAGFTQLVGVSSRMLSPLAMSYLDSPATTSSVTYAVYFRSGTAGQQVDINNSGAKLTITVMEVAG